MRKTPFNVMRHAEWDRSPRIAATFAFFTATVGLGTTAAVLATAATYIAVTAVTSWAISALSPKPDFSGMAGASGSQGRLVNAKEPAAPHDFVYGQVRKGGTVTYYETTGTNNKYLHQIIALAGHEVEEIGDIYINDEIVTFSGDLVTGKWASKIRIQKFRGDQTTAPADLVAESNQVNSTFVGNGIAYLYIRYAYDQDVFANGLPLITAVVKGKKVYDPRTATTAYSNNPALCIRDYIGAAYGMQDSDVDDVSFQAAANVCDEAVALGGGGTEARYTMNGLFTAGTVHRDVLSQMMTSCAGTLFWGGGQFKLVASEYVAPTKVLTLDDLRSPISLDTRTNLRDQFNKVQGTFNDASNRWITADYPPITSSVFEAEDGGEQTPLDLELPMTTSGATAQRIAKLTLYRGREQMALTADFGLNALDVEVGEIVSLPFERYGWDNIAGMPAGKEFEVTGWKFGPSGEGDLRVTLSLREISEAAFDWNAEEQDIISNNTSLFAYTDVPPVGIDVVADLQVSNEKVSNIAVATVTSGRASEIDYVEVEYKRASDATYSAFGQGPLGEFRVRDLAVDTYDFRARAVNGFGYRGEFEYLAGVSINPFTGPPSDVASLTVELSGGTLFLSWPPVADLDLSHYRLKHNSQTTGATWANSSTVIERIARPGTQTTLPARAGTFLIRAYDKEGNFSDNFTAATVSPTELPPLGVTETQTEDPTFAGAKTNVIIADSALEIDDTSAASPTGEYLFAAYIDTGSDRNARVTGIRTFERRFDNGTMLWDDIPGNWDTWPGNWDTWTDEGTEFGDVNVTVYVSATPDDPAGTPTWGAYVPANGAEVQGRAFRFKAVLTSDSTSFTPAITALSATVEY